MLIYLMALDTEEEKIKFVKIYDAYRDRMHYTASIILKDELNAEDMVHDTFLTLTDYLDRIDEEDFTGTWNYIGFTQGLKENVDVHVTYDGTGSRKIQVNGKEIYVIKDKEITSFYYEDNGCIITLSSTEKELELIKILKNIK